MKDKDKTKEQLISELAELHKRFAQLKTSETERKQTEEALKNSEKKYHDLLDNANDLIQYVGPDARIIFVNKKWLETLEYSEEELKNLKVTDILHENQIARIMGLFKGTATGGTVKNIETTFISKYGKEIYVEGNGSGVIEDGKFIGAIGIFRDITERKQAEETLQKSKKKYEALINNIPEAIYSCLPDKNATVLYISDRFGEWTGYYPDDFYRDAKTWPNCIHPEDRDRAVAGFTEAFSNNKELDLEYRVVHKDTGQVRYVRDHSSPVLDSDGNIRHYDGILSDMTERKRAEEALRESEGRFRAIFDTVNDGILLADLGNQKFYMGNTVICQMLGYSLEEIKSLGITDIHPEEDLPYVLEQFDRQAKGDITLATDIPIKRKGGSVFYADVNSARITLAGRTYLLGTFRDITERKQTEENLEKYMESAPDGVYINDLRGTFLYGNKRAEELTGYPREELIGKNFLNLNLLSKKDMIKAGKALALSIVGKSTGPDEFELLRKDGSHIWVEINTVPLKEAGGKKVVVGFVRDTTERKKAEAKIQQFITELKEALAKVKTLSGLLPICAWCKNIRNDEGYWQAVEQYVGEHTTAEFTHGICPDCVKKYYPELEQEVSREEKDDSETA